MRYIASGYASRNTEWVNTVGVAYAGEQAEALLLYSNRHGHEMKSAGGYTIPEDSRMTRYRGYGKQTPDDSTHHNNSYLAKFAYRLNDNHREGLTAVHAIKIILLKIQRYRCIPRWREADDRAKRDTINVFYEYLPDSKIIALVKTDVDYQKAQQLLITMKVIEHKLRQAIAQLNPEEPSDNNLRFFNTKFKRINFRVDSQPIDLGTSSHTFSLKTAVSERKFDILHQDSVYVDNNYDGVKEWVNSKDSTMMHLIKTRHYNISSA